MNRKTAAAIFGTTALFFAASASAQSIPIEAQTADATTSITVRNDSTQSAPDAPWRDTGLTSGAMTALSTSPAKPVSVPFDPAQMMPVEEIRPGMTGYGMTVFSGLEPERFEAEVIGVRHRMLAGTDIILCRLKSPHLVDLGVVAGMSGSPVYIDGRLIGAVAYGFIDVDDPLAGVTPISEMLNVYNSTPTEPASSDDEFATGNGMAAFDSYMALRADPTASNLQRVALSNSPAQNLTFRASDFGTAAADRFHLPHTFTLEPLSAPVFIGGESSLTSKLADTVFPALNIISNPADMAPVATGPGALPAVSSGIPSTRTLNAPGGPIADLQAFSDKITGGYALAVPFVEGDLNMAGVGTITWRHNDRLIAFGHPMMQQGTVYFPMAAARINAVIRSRTRPFKLGEPVGHIGMVRQDRVPAIGGLFGQTAKMFNLKALIDDPEYLGQHEYNYRIWNDRQMSPGLLLSCLGESIGTAARADGDSAALFSYNIALDDGTTITAEDYRSDSNGTLAAIIGAMADVGTLMNNPFKPVGINDIQFHMKVTDRLRDAKIEAAVMDKAVYRPGETATVEWVLRPYRAEAVKLEYSFAVPEGLPDGDYNIVVMDADTRQELESKRNPGGKKLNDYEDIVRLIQQNYPSNRVYVALVDQDTGVSISGKEMPRLPGSIINLLQTTVDGEYFEPVRGNFVIDADLPTTYDISGEATTKLTIERR